ncbi:MAG: UDP-N-acetylmuramate dehydrogenase [Nitriliruptoraceae bacterium]
MTVADELSAVLTQPLQHHASLHEYTTLRVGGTARYLATVNSEQELRGVAQIITEYGLSWWILGRGSNTLVSDDGFDGLVLVLGRGFRGIVIDGLIARVGAAEPLPILASTLADNGLAGFSWGCGVPGAVGGAVRMNAGAHGRDMADNLIEVDVYRLSLQARETWPRDALGLQYRRSELPKDAIVLSATFQFALGDPAVLRDEVAEIRQWRRDHQPLNQPNCGSVFANPASEQPAAQLIDRCGLKGFTIGGASVSTTHANFIVTSLGATASDVVALIDAVKQRVHVTTGVMLREEVVMLASGGVRLAAQPQENDTA